MTLMSALSDPGRGLVCNKFTDNTWFVMICRSLLFGRYLFLFSPPFLVLYKFFTLTVLNHYPLYYDPILNPNFLSHLYSIKDLEIGHTNHNRHYDYCIYSILSTFLFFVQTLLLYDLICKSPVNLHTWTSNLLIIFTP